MHFVENISHQIAKKVKNFGIAASYSQSTSQVIFMEILS